MNTKSINDLDLTIRTKNILSRFNVTSVEQLTKENLKALREKHGRQFFSHQTIREILEVVNG